MRKIRFVKVVVPEIVAYIGSDVSDMAPDYRCPECGSGISNDYLYCPYCSVELNWEKVRKPSARFQNFLNRSL